MTETDTATAVQLSHKLPTHLRAAVFDLDGVLTSTTRLHSECWKRTFNEFLHEWDAAQDTVTAPFVIASDYASAVDGRARHNGVRQFLASRGIELPEGTRSDPPGEWTINGLARRKQQLVDEWLVAKGVEAFPGSVAWMRQLRDDGIAIGVVTASRNGSRAIDAAGIADLVDVQLDGELAAELGLAPRPAPDTFLEAARRLGVSPIDTVVAEDDLLGVQAAVAGGFGMVIGVDRSGFSEALRDLGADLVVDDLAEMISEAAEVRHPAGPRLHRLHAATQRLLSAEADFPIDPHRIVERHFDPAHIPQLETVFALANGYLGFRGSHDEGHPAWSPAAYLNGFYDTWPIVYPEQAYGFARTGQTMVAVPDAAVISLYIDDARVGVDRIDPLEYERVLDMRKATVERRVLWVAPDGARFQLTTRRLVSLEFRHLALLDWEVVSLDRPARMVISSAIMGHQPAEELVDDTTEIPEMDDPRRVHPIKGQTLQRIDERFTGDRAVMCYQTRASGRRMACGIDHHLDAGQETDPHIELLGEDGARVTYRVTAETGRPIHLTKYIAYHHGDESGEELCFRVSGTLDQAMSDGIDQILSDHRNRVDQFWQRSDVITDGAPLLQQAVRFNLFQLLQATARVEGFGVPPKGLTGGGYEGHYFWDTEIYVMPFLTYTSPHIARSLLRHRYAMLPAARARAAEISHRGALFPWRTINGEEASAYYAAGTAQYHIDADVAYALGQYVNATGDRDFLARLGAEVLVETARMWADLGFFSARKGGHFVINGVTGPDEYSTVVDNNTFTNLMARHNLRMAVDAVEWLLLERPSDYARLAQRTGLQRSELATWRRAAALMFIPFDHRAQVHRQDDAFLDREVWDFEGTAREKYPLLLHYHPLVLYRHQVVKQADVVLATYLLGEEFTAEEKRRVFEYYDPLTTGDSSLSECIQAIMAAEIGDLRAAEEYLIDASSIDLTDAAGNVRDGVHVAAAGGTWMALVNGFGGMRHRGDTVSFCPRLPERLSGLSFRVRIGDCTLLVDIERSGATYRLLEGTELPLTHFDKPVLITRDPQWCEAPA